MQQNNYQETVIKYNAVFKMSGNTESTSNSIKFAPMPMSALLANLMPLQKESDTPDSSFLSADESDDDSIGETVSKKPSTNNKINRDFYTPVIKPKSKEVKAVVLEKKACVSTDNKENISSSFRSNLTHPTKDSLISQTPKLFPQPTSEVKKRNVLLPFNNSTVKSTNSDIKQTPEMIKVQNSAQKNKSSTPGIKSGIRKFTPNSAKKSHKKTPQNSMIPSRDRVRCELFTQNKKDEKSNQIAQPQPIIPEPETPLNKKLIPASYAATPSYPQGAVGNNSKILFKTTNIKDKKYMFIKKLGIGGSSEVYKVLEVGTSCEYAVKCVYLATDHELAQGYINEVRLLRELQNSDRVVKLYDYEYDKSQQLLRMVLEVGETDLSTFLKGCNSGVPPALVLHYWEEMLHAVNYIHENGVIHADLKPANFLLVSGRLKLIDFGIASSVSGDATSVVRAQAAGTYSYISPEALLGGAGQHAHSPPDGSAPIKISFRSDVWSLGCILYSMVYGHTPFAHIRSLAKLAAILDPNHRIEYPPAPHLPPSLLSTLKWCLTYNARGRPYVRELLAVQHLQPPSSPLPQPLLDKLQKLVTPQEYSLLQRAQI